MFNVYCGGYESAHKNGPFLMLHRKRRLVRTSLTCARGQEGRLDALNGRLDTKESMDVKDGSRHTKTSATDVVQTANLSVDNMYMYVRYVRRRVFLGI